MWWVIMKLIKKGSKITKDSYIITEKERIEYIRLKKKMELLKQMADTYKKQYKYY